MSSPLFFVVLAGLGFQIIPADVHAFQVTPGKWQFEYESRASFEPQPQKRMDIQCVKDSSWDPAASIAKSGHCQLHNVRQDRTSFSATVTCGRGAGNPPMTGSMTYSSTGTTMTSRTVFKGEGYDMEMQTRGKWLGACD